MMTVKEQEALKRRVARLRGQVLRARAEIADLKVSVRYYIDRAVKADARAAEQRRRRLAIEKEFSA